jgi:hypothetical protein
MCALYGRSTLAHASATNGKHALAKSARVAARCARYYQSKLLQGGARGRLP